MKKRLIIISTIFILMTIVIYTLLYFKTDIFKPNKDITIAKNRKSYVISEDKNLSNFTNKYDKTLIVFWATWCSYCVDEAEALNEYISSNPYKSIIIISHDNNKDDLKNYLEENGYNWFVILDSEKTIRENLETGSTGIPSSYLLDKDGKIINFHKGKLTTNEFASFFNEVEI